MMNKLSEKARHYAFVSGAVATTLLILFVFTANFKGEGKSGDTHNATPLLSDQVLVSSFSVNPFDDVLLQAKAAVVYDLNAGRILYAKNPHAPLPLASLTKVMTAIVASESIPSYASVPIEPAHLSVEGESGLRAGERWSVSELLSFVLTISSNDGARALASASSALDLDRRDNNATSTVAGFIDRMNQKAGALHLKNMRFFNESGLDLSESLNGGYGTAYEVALLMHEALRTIPKELSLTRFDAEIFTSLGGIPHEAKNTNLIANKLPGLIASKTGFTDLAGGNLAVIIDIDINQPIAIVVLGSTEAGRFLDTETLLEATRAAFQQN